MGFDSLTWKIKQGFRKIVPLALVGALCYGGYTVYKDGTFRRGVVPGIQKLLAKMPVFGSKFRRHSYDSGVSRGSSYRSGKRSYRKHRGHSRRSRRHRR